VSTAPAEGHRAYLDHAATTPLRPEALEAMLPLLTDGFANPSGAHAESRRARIALDDARDLLAELLGAAPGEIVLTSGGTEADDLAITGGWEAVAAVPVPGRPHRGRTP
jgi:cysteine desulfurase